MIGGMNYPGGKAKTFQHIINLMPPHEVYIEPFLGFGSVIRQKSRSPKEIALDLNPKVLQDEFFTANSILTLNQDAVAFLRAYKFEGHEVIYCDPPYYPSTRKRERVYKFDFNEQDHVDFLEVISKINARVIISGYASEIYNKYLSSWNFYTFKAKAHDGVRDECVWYNFARPAELHDYAYLGSNFRDRQKIKRRLERVKNRLEELTAQERAYLLSWLKETSCANQ